MTEILVVLCSYILSKIFIETSTIKSFEYIILAVIGIIFFCLYGSSATIEICETLSKSKNQKLKYQVEGFGIVEIRKMEKPKLYFSALILLSVSFLLIFAVVGMLLARLF